RAAQTVGFHVRADTKRAVTRAGEHTDAQHRIIAKLAPDLGEPAVGFTITGIEPLGTIDGHVRHRAFFSHRTFMSAFPAFSSERLDQLQERSVRVLEATKLAPGFVA